MSVCVPLCVFAKTAVDVLKHSKKVIYLLEHETLLPRNVLHCPLSDGFAKFQDIFMTHLNAFMSLLSFL